MHRFVTLPRAVAALIGSIALAMLFASPGTAPAVEADGHSFFEGFDGLAPAQPTPFRSPNWDLTVHTRQLEYWYDLEPVDAAHGPNCEGPPSTHRNTSYEGSVFNCRNHMMTAINASHYGLIYATPNHMVDFSDGEAVISWDMSTFRTSVRDWVDVFITPWGEVLQAPLDGWLPDLNGKPRNGIHIRMDQFNGLQNTAFRVYVIRDFQQEEIPGIWWQGYETFLTPDKARRDTFELRISQDHIRFGMPDYGFYWVDADMAPLNWDQGVVQFGQHSYTPSKDGGNGPNSYHWDNFSISPSVPFSMIKADRRYVDKTSTDTFQLAAPAPANGVLRFMGVGALDVSFNGGASWQTPQRQAMTKAEAGQFKSYWTSIPAGATSVKFRGGPEGWFPEWHVRDLSVWTLAQGQGAAPPPPTPTPTPSPTATPSPTPTATPSPTPTATPSPTPTATPSPTPTATPTPGAAPVWELVSVSAPQTAAAGEQVTVTATVRNAGGAGSFLVDMEIVDPAGAKVSQRFWDNQQLAAGESRTFTLQHVLGASSVGSHSVDVGLFQPGWAQLETWHASAATIDVSASFSVTAAGGWAPGLGTATVTAQSPVPVAVLAERIVRDSGRAVAQIATNVGGVWRFYRPGFDAASNLTTIPAGTTSITVLLE